MCQVQRQTLVPIAKRSFNVWSRLEHDWTWLWCVTKYICSCMTTYTYIYVYSNEIHHAGATHMTCTALLWRPWGHRQTNRRAATQKCVSLSTLSARRLKSGPKTNTFRKFRQVLSENNRPVVTEVDLEGMTLSHQRVLLEGKCEMVFRTDVSQRWVSTIVL